MYAPPHSRPSRAKSVAVGLGRAQQLTLKLDFVLYDQSLALVINLGGEFRRNGMMGSWVLEDEAFVALHARVDSGLLYRPFSNVRPVFFTLGVLLLRMRNLPSCLPVISELFEEGSFQGGRLCKTLACCD
jgi:hypothetical protein